MRKFLETVKKHLIASIAILLGGLAIIITGVSFLSSVISYSVYSDEYEKNKEELLSKTPQLPKEVFRDNQYVTYDDNAKTVTSSKSKYKGTHVYDIHDAVVKLDEGEPSYNTIEGTAWDIASGFTKGGSITYKINAANYGKSDIDIVLAVGEVKTQKGFVNTGWNQKSYFDTDIKIGNVSDYLFIKINGLSVLTSDFNLPVDGGFQHLILKDTHLLEGENTLALETNLSIDNNLIMPAVRNIAVITDVTIA
ncbi:MAG: hypothetical protein K6G74_02070 [Bacilli bacterium]|nr:hypothetical protein [Bacilli bacterium]